MQRLTEAFTLVQVNEIVLLQVNEALASAYANNRVNAVTY